MDKEGRGSKSTKILQLSYLEAPFEFTTQGNRIHAKSNVHMPSPVGGLSCQPSKDSLWQIPGEVMSFLRPFRAHLSAKDLSVLAALWHDLSKDVINTIL